ncbi:hypothetical protein F4820DRAFT_447734 [Hypoxylon rubiginosum]|uniref:Uncharacterized protein n=1 Tax=Hypoxylon rubiginosum TaxID=110542 RepID=A0ACB9Z236_9PEZI|nr:hypothetical protein F4820DRAFT_447734 [Hypoxylon rubiginosum]
MSVRPSSSSGPSSKSSISSSFKYDKRISRDDSFVNSRAGPGAGFKPYTFARGQLPTPESSPRSSPRKASIPTARMPTPDSLNDGRFTEIGMALGSPTKPTSSGSRPPQASLRYRQASAPSIVSPSSRTSIAESYDKPLPRKQSGKWKLFSRFGKKSSDHSQQEPHEQKGAPRSEQQTPDMTSQPWYDTKMERSHTVNTRGTARHKPIVVRSQTMPYEADASAQGAKSKPHDRKAKETFGRIPIALDHKPASSGPLLDVEIPSITMERYSVMFGSVLQPQHQPSLLARRQATVQKLKTIDDAIEKEEEEKHHHIPRRATSPQPATKSPPLALFPATPSQKPVYPSVSNASPRLRSNTSPALLRSPSTASFNHSTPHRRQPSKDELKPHNHKEPAVHPNHKGKLTIATLARARQQQAAVAREYQFSPDSSNLILESPTDISSPEFEVVRSDALRPPASYMQEPKWQMVTPPQQTTPSTASTSMASDRKPSPSSPASSAHSDLSAGTSRDADDDVLENSANMNPVELSIARQISISRQQRKLLRPLQTGPTALRPRPSPSKLAPVPKIAMGKNERLAETKSSTPTLVTPEESYGSPLAWHRKSERVVLDRA